MKKIGWVGIWVALLGLVTGAWAEMAVTNLVVTQRLGTKLADISYDVSNTETGNVWVSLAVNNAGTPVVATSLTGDVGLVVPGTGKAMAWDMGADWNGNFALLSFVLTTDIEAPAPTGMVFVQGGSLPDIGNGAITVSNFFIGKYEVTKAQWDEVYSWAIGNGYDIPVGGGCATNHPVQSVNWYDVVKWCNAKSQKEGRTPAYTVSGSVYRSGQTNDVTVSATANGYRLPTDAQWEFAARGGTLSQGYEYSGGNDVGAVAWYEVNSGGAACIYDWERGTWPVGGKAANELGIYDMSGNVWEWCFDWYPGYEGAYRVFRGGSWGHLANDCRSAYHSHDNPDYRNNSIGFRAVALPPDL